MSKSRPFFKNLLVHKEEIINTGETQLQGHRQERTELKDRMQQMHMSKDQAFQAVTGQNENLKVELTQEKQQRSFLQNQVNGLQAEMQ